MKKILPSVLLVFASAVAMAIGHTIVTSSTNVSCYGTADGTATASVSGGVGPFTYNWTPNGGTNATATGLGAGSYTITVTDQNDLSTATKSVVITQPTPIVISSSGSSICPGECTILSANGSGGILPINYSWNPGSLAGASVSVCPTMTTTYTTTGTDGNGCTGKTTVVVTVNPMPTVSVPPATICLGNSATLTASGASSYTWQPANGLSSTAGSVVSANPSLTTTYTTIGTNNFGCTNTTTVVVTVLPPCGPSVNTSGITVCNGACGTITSTASGGTPPYNYIWSTGETNASLYICPVTNTTYTVTIMDSAVPTGTASAIAIVTVNPGPAPNITGNTTICNGGSTTLTANGGGSYSWNTGHTTASINVSPVTTTTYTVTVTTNGCTGTSTMQITVLPPVIVTITSNNNICPGQTATLTASGGVNYVWSTAQTGNSIAVNPASTTTYTVVATIAGCAGTATHTVIVSCTGIEEITNLNTIIKAFPNPFTDNTTFIIQSDKPNETYSFELLDVLGKQVRSVKEITGKEFRISRNGLPNGIYFYKFYTGESIVGTGKLIVK